jgi:SAM-dependent methyltransferase
LKLGGLELLPQLGETFDKVFSVNVLQFLRDRAEVIQTIRSVLKPNGLVATTVQPRHRGAKAEDAHAFACKLSLEMIDGSFHQVTVKELDLKPIPAVCCSHANDRHVLAWLTPLVPRRHVADNLAVRPPANGAQVRQTLLTA